MSVKDKTEGLVKYAHILSISEEEQILKEAAKYLMSIKGFWTGFVRAIYRDSEMEVNHRCFSKDLLTEIYFLINFIEGQESLTQLPKFIVTFAKIFNDNFQYCGYVQLANDLEAFCDKVGCGK